MLVSLISRLVACSPRIVVDRQTHRTTTVTLAAHARRGLMTALAVCQNEKVVSVPRIKVSAAVSVLGSVLEVATMLME